MNIPEYILTYYHKSENDILNSYLQKLVSKQLYLPNKPKTPNNLIIFEWDDTLLPATFLTEGTFENIILSILHKIIKYIINKRRCLYYY